MRDLILLAVTTVCSFIALWNPAFGLLTYVGYSVVNPQSYTWDIARDFPHSKVIAVVTILGFIFSSDGKKFIRQRESFLLLALWGLFGLSTVFAIYPDSALYGFILISKILLLAILSTFLINTEHKLHLLLKIIALGMGLYGLKAGIFVLLTGGHSAISGPDDSYFSANNTIGMALAMNVPLLFYLAKTETRTWLKWIMRGMLVFSYPAVAGTFARADWIGLAVITLLLGIKSKHKLLTWTAGGILTALAVVWVPQIVSNEMTNRYGTLVNYEEDASAESRFWNWEFCRRVGTANPLTGAGFGFYSEEAYVRYYPEFLTRWPGKVWSCHNMWLSVLAEHGLIAFMLWVGLLASCFLSLRRIRAYGRAHEGLSWMTDYADMLQITLVGFMVMGTFVDFAYYEVYYQLVAVVVIIKQKMLQRGVEEPSMAIVAGMNRSVLNPRGGLVPGWTKTNHL
jgi:putative inorganic carbon (HCO3(-)) transporter